MNSGQFDKLTNANNVPRKGVRPRWLLSVAP